MNDLHKYSAPAAHSAYSGFADFEVRRFLAINLFMQIPPFPPPETPVCGTSTSDAECLIFNETPPKYRWIFGNSGGIF